MSTKRKAPTKLAQPAARQNAKAAVKANINEADTAVSTVDPTKSTDKQATEDVIEISSDSGSSDYEFSDEEGNKDDAPAGPRQAATPPRNAHLIPNGDVDAEMHSPHPPADGESDHEAVTFGDLVRANETVDVPSALAAQQPTTVAAAGKAIAPPSLASLGTVLTQALRTDDRDLLESCLHTTDLATVRNTIQRLDSSLAGTLLTKLAARMHRRPGRAGSLMAWVQWTLIAHGGALATQPALVKKLSELNKVLEERSRGLNSLLALKGKLDMLEAQMQLRRSMQTRGDSDSENDAEEGVVYVEGEERDGIANGLDVDDDDELPVTNGVANDESEDDEDMSDGGDSDEELEGAEEPVDEDEVDHDDVESEDGDEDSEGEAAPPAKKRGKFSKKR